MNDIPTPDGLDQDSVVVQFRLRPRLGSASLDLLKGYCCHMIYKSLRDTHSDQEADSFVVAAVGYIEGAISYLAEEKKLKNASRAIGRLQELLCSRDPNEVATYVESITFHNLRVCHGFYGPDHGIAAAERLIAVATDFLRSHGQGDRATRAVAETLAGKRVQL